MNNFTLPSSYSKDQVLSNNCELELLLYCCQTFITPEIEAKIKTLLRYHIDWQKLIQIANFHGVIPLLYHKLKTIYPEAFSSLTFNQLELHFKLNQISNQLLTQELLKILNLFRENNIIAIPFKGVPLTTVAYGNLALRQFCDLDILVRNEDFVKAKDLLISQFNYQPKSGQRQFLPWLFGKMRSNNRHDYTLIKKSDKAIIDLHQKVVGEHYCAFPMDFQELWERCETVYVGQTKILSFHREDLLLILCVHSSKHLWRELKWICDITQLINVSPEINWNRVIYQSQKLGCKRILLISLLLTKELFKNTLPREIEQSIQNDNQCKLFAQKICETILFHSIDNSSKQAKIKQMIIQIRMLDFFKDRLRFSTWLCWQFFISPIFEPFRQNLT